MPIRSDRKDEELVFNLFALSQQNGTINEQNKNQFPGKRRLEKRLDAWAHIDQSWLLDQLNEPDDCPEWPFKPVGFALSNVIGAGFSHLLPEHISSQIIANFPVSNPKVSAGLSEMTEFLEDADARLNHAKNPEGQWVLTPELLPGFERVYWAAMNWINTPYAITQVCSWCGACMVGRSKNVERCSNACNVAAHRADKTKT